MPRKKCPCGKIPIYGIPAKHPECCIKCKTEDMINVVAKKCPCGKQPVFGFIGKRPECCKECKSEDMVNVRKQNCPCGKQPVFGLIGKRPECCKECKTDDMVNVRQKTCPCGKRPSFGILGGQPECCKECKFEDMVYVVNKTCPCGKQPVFGFIGKRPECCKECKSEDMVDVLSKKCPGYNDIPCPVMTQLQYGKRYCLICNPDTKHSTYKIDEKAFFNYLDNNGICITQREYRIDYACLDISKSHSFIDGIIISKDIVICLEVDEEAHRNYDPVCEKTRLNDASAELRLQYTGHYIAWVRINPNILDSNDRRDRSAKAIKIRDFRHKEALDIITNLLKTPIDCIKYIGY
jgi:hypothetical protein